MTDEPADTAAATATPAPDNNQPATPTPSPEPPEFTIPDAYKDKAWASKVKTQDDLWKQLENTQALIGKKVVVPDWEKADPKEIDEYIGNLRPKDKAAYQFTDDVPEAERGVYADMLHEIGIPAYQANKLVPKFMEYFKTQAAKEYDYDGFLAKAEEKFGAGYKEKIVKARVAVKEALPKELTEKVDSLPNEAHVAFYEAMNTILDKYGAKETGAGGEGGEGEGSAVDKTEARKAIRAEIAALEKRPHTIEEKMALNNKLAETYKG